MLINRNLTVRSIAEITGLLLGAAGMIYTSRIVGPEYIGFSATTVAIVIFISRFVDGGVTSLASQRLARDDEKLDTLLSITIPPKIIISSFFIVVFFLTIGWLDIDSRLRYFISISIFMIMFEVCTPTWAFVALGRIKDASVIRVGQSLLYISAILILVRKPDDWKYLPYLVLMNSFINFGIALFLLLHFRLYSFNVRNLSIFKQGYLSRVVNFYRDSFHFLKADLSVHIYTYSGKLILYYFTGPYAVGIYEAAYKIISPFYSISSVITPTMFRDLAQSFKHRRIYPVMTKYAFSMALFTIPLGFFLLFFSRFIIELFYGTTFIQSADCLIVLGFVITFGYTSGITVLPFSAWNMSREYGNSIFLGNILNILLNISLIPFMGAVGAALAVLGAKLIVTVVGLFYFRRATEYPLINNFLYFIIVSAITSLFTLGASFLILNNYVLMIIYGFVYLGIVSVTYKSHFRYNYEPVISWKLLK